MTKRPQTIQIFPPSGDLRGLTVEKSAESPACHVKPLSFLGQWRNASDGSCSHCLTEAALR